MLSKSQFLGSIENELKICKHLHGKLQDSHLDFKPCDDMRSTRELLRYISRCGFLPTHAMINDDWQSVPGLRDEADSMDAADFPAALDRQLDEIKALLEDVSEEDLQNREIALPWGPKMPLGLALVETSLKFLTAYRMQLYLYAKQAGVAGLSTANCWLGADPPAA